MHIFHVFRPTCSMQIVHVFVPTCIYIYKLVHVFRRIFTYPKRSESLENVQIFPAVVFVCIIYILWSPFQIYIYACCKVVVSSNSACSTNRRTLALVVDTVQQQRRTLVLIHIFVQKRRLEFYLDLCPVANDPCSFLLRFPLIRGISDCSARSAICFANRHCIYTIICFLCELLTFIMLNIYFILICLTETVHLQES